MGRNMDPTWPTDWLLEATTPSIRYLTRILLLKQSENEREAKADRRAIKEQSPAPSILRAQLPTGSWKGEHSYYTPKYTSTHWSMLLLSELRFPGSDPQYQRGVEYMLTSTQEGLHGALDDTYGLACFWGNLLRYSLDALDVHDARVQTVIAYLSKEALDTDWRCRHNADLPCAWGAVRALWGLASIPPTLRTEQIKSTLENGLSFLLEQYDLSRADYPTSGTVHKLWKRLNFPLFYQADILFTLRVVAELDALDRPGTQTALDWLRAQRLKNGRWRGANPYRQRTWEGLADRPETNRWVSLHAAWILDQADGLKPG